MNWTPLIFGWDRLNSKRLVHFILTSVGSLLDIINALEIRFLILPTQRWFLVSSRLTKGASLILLDFVILIILYYLLFYAICLS